MTPQFTTNCYVRVDDKNKQKEICDKLFKMGYRHIWDSNEQFKSIVYADTEDAVVRLLRNADGLGIDCGTNTDLFLALVGMRSDTHYHQWFIKYKSSHGSVSGMRQKKGEMFKSCREFIYSTCITDYYRRATAQEIIEYFNKKGETK